MPQSDFSFSIGKRLSETTAAGEGLHGRTGTITTPHGEIQTPAFIAVGLGLVAVFYLYTHIEQITGGASFSPTGDRHAIHVAARYRL